MPKSNDVNFVDTTDDADNALINCALFGNAVNMIHDNTISSTFTADLSSTNEESFSHTAR